MPVMSLTLSDLGNLWGKAGWEEAGLEGQGLGSMRQKQELGFGTGSGRAQGRNNTGNKRQCWGEGEKELGAKQNEYVDKQRDEWVG